MVAAGQEDGNERGSRGCECVTRQRAVSVSRAVRLLVLLGPLAVLLVEPSPTLPERRLPC